MLYEVITKAGELLQSFFKEHGFDRVHVDEYGNVIGTIRGKRQGKKLLFDGHIDTVPVVNQEKWTHDPFAAVV